MPLMESMPRGRKKATPPPPTAENERPKAGIVGKPEQKELSGLAKHREDGLNGLLQLGMFGLIMSRQLADAGALSVHGPNIARETAALAETNDKLGRYIDYAVAVGPYAGILSAVMPFAAQILVNHKAMPAEAGAMLGVVHPEALEAKMKAELAEQALAAMREQQQAEAKLQAVADQMAPPERYQEESRA